MVHLEPWIHKRIETSIRSIFHVSPRIMAVPISPYEQLESKRVHQQLQQRTRPKRKIQDTDTRHKTQDTRYKKQDTKQDTDTRHKIQDTRYKKQDTKTFLPKELATEFAINTCIFVKFFKLQRVPSSNNREEYHINIIFPSINKRYSQTVPRHRQTSS